MTHLPVESVMAARSLRRGRFVAAAIVAALAVAIAVTTIVYQIATTLLIRPISYPALDGLVLLEEAHRDRGTRPVSWPTFVDWATQGKAFDTIAAIQYGQAAAVLDSGARRVATYAVTDAFLPISGAKLHLGRGFLPAEYNEAGPSVMLLTHEFWLDAFGGDRAVVGRAIRVDGRMVTVIGVLDRSFSGPFGERADAVVVLDRNAQPQRRDQRSLVVVARLRNGVTIDEARANLTVVSKTLATMHHDTNRDWGASVIRLSDRLVAPYRKQVVGFVAIAASIVIIACFNAATLLLARAAGRRRETGVLVALGATRIVLVKRVAYEVVIVTVFALAIGVGASYAGIGLVRYLAPPFYFGLKDLALHPAIAGSAALLCSGAVLLLCAPSLAYYPVDPRLDADASNRTVGSSTNTRTRSGLVLVQIAGAFTLTVCVLLLVTHLLAIWPFQPGFRPEGKVTFRVSVDGRRLPTPLQKVEYPTAVLERTRSISGVTAVAATQAPPFDAFMSLADVSASPVTAAPSGAPSVEANYRVVDAAFFDVMGIPVREGRRFQPEDTDTSPQVAIVSASLARKLWPFTGVIGQQATIAMGNVASTPASGAERPMWQVVAIVGDVMGSGPSASPETIYVPLTQSPPNGLTVIAESPVGAAIVPSIRAAIKRLNPDQSLDRIASYDEIVARRFAEPRFYVLLGVALAIVAVALAGSAVLSLVDHSVRLRDREIAIRLSVGATRASVTALILRSTARLAVIGIAVGLVGAILAQRAITALIGAQRIDATLVVFAAAVTLAAVMTTAYVPARRAARRDPVAILRE
jgi:putative ABC transport system permease protein